MPNITLALFMTLIVGVIEFFSKRLHLRKKPYFEKIISFSAGLSITYLLLELIPVFTEGAFQINKLIFLSLLLGFISHHVIEKEIYKHSKNHDLVKRLNQEENVFYYVYHLILGFVFVLFIELSLVEGLFFFISVVAYTLASNLPATPHKSESRMLFLSSSTFTGAVIAALLPFAVPLWVQYSLIGLVGGVLLFTVTRHHIPYKRTGRILYFLLGAAIYAAFIISKWVN